MTISGFLSGESYAQWVRRTVSRRAADGRIVALFDSSVPEPRELLCDIVAQGFAAPVDPRYTSAFAGGNPFVVDALCDAYGVTRDRILCTTGATSALALLYRALAVPGTRILIETPGFDLFADIARRQGIGFDTFARSGADHGIDVDAVAAALRPETRVVVLSDLHNPTGVLLPRETLIRLGALAEAHDLTVLVDEVYGDYATRAARPLPAAALSPRLVSIGSLTKIYGLSTLRCGWIVADPAVLAPVRKVADRTEFGISNLAHAAAAMVLAHKPRFDAYAADVLARARPVAEDWFDRWQRDELIVGALPDFGCIAFPRLVGVDDTEAFADRLADDSGVIVAPGEYFGAPGHVRIGFARDPESLMRGLSAVDAALRRQVPAAARRATATTAP